MLSIPPAATTSRSPSAIAEAASMVAFMPDAQTLFTVVASDECPNPDNSATWRAGDWPTPAWMTLPK